MQYVPSGRGQVQTFTDPGWSPISIRPLHLPDHCTLSNLLWGDLFFLFTLGQFVSVLWIIPNKVVTIIVTVLLSFYPIGASSEQTIKINIRQPFSTDGLRDLLVAFKGLLENNYPASCMALGRTVMSLGYQRIVQAGGSCPVVLLTGDTETSKTTVLKACISLTHWKSWYLLIYSPLKLLYLAIAVKSNNTFQPL